MSHLKTWEGGEDYSKGCELPHSKRSKRQESKVCCLLLIILTFGDCHATYDSNLEDRRKKLNIVMLSKRKLIFYHEKKKRANTKVLKVVCCILSKQKTYFWLFLFNLHLLTIHKRERSRTRRQKKIEK